MQDVRLIVFRPEVIKGHTAKPPTEYAMAYAWECVRAYVCVSVSVWVN